MIFIKNPPVQVLDGSREVFLFVAVSFLVLFSIIANLQAFHRGDKEAENTQDHYGEKNYGKNDIKRKVGDRNVQPEGKDAEKDQ